MIHNPSKYFVFLGTLLFTLTPSFASANPSGGVVVAGNASISQSGNSTVINEGSSSAIINWQTFNISPNEITQFIQPNSNAIVLNRVNASNGASQIFGTLTANGNVWILNSAGIMFAKGSQVNVGGLLATTADIKNDDFMNGKYSFAETGKYSGAIVNNGNITARDGGLVALVAPGVENNGVIQANLGKVVLASGTNYTLDLYGDHLINFGVNSQTQHAGVDANGRVLKNAVSNTGTIIANGGKVYLTARTAENVVDNSINMSGVIVAKTAYKKNGVIVLSGGDNGVVDVSGDMDASGQNAGETGGRVKITGHQIALNSGTRINTSGQNGGGEVLVGGDSHGANKHVKNAEDVYVDKNASIDADAITNGDGGKVVVWSDNTTEFDGTITSHGGSQSGNGGNVETSGAQNLGVGADAVVDSISAHGQAGDWLMDPANIIVANGGAATLSAVSAFANSPTLTLTIDPSTINGALANVILQANSDITFTNAINMTNAGVGLTAQAGRSIIDNANITTNNGAINFEANDSTGTTSANRGSSAAGSITMAGTTTINSGGGTIDIKIDPTTAASPNTYTAGSITLNNLTSGGGAITVTSPNALTLNTNSTISSGAGNVTLNTNTGGGANNFLMNAGSAINTTGGTVNINVNNNAIAAGGTGTATLRAITTNGGTLNINDYAGTTSGGGAITQSAGTILNVGNANFFSGNTLAAGAITLTQANDFTGTVTVNTLGTNAASITDANALTLGNCTVGGAFTATATAGNLTNNGAITAGTSVTENITTGGTGSIINNGNITAAALTETNNGAITQTGGALTISGASTFNAGVANDITLNNANNFGSIGITNGNNVSINDINGLILNASNVSGNLGITTNGAITQAGALVITGATTLNAGAGNNITLGTATNNFNSVKINAANNVQLTDAGSIVLDASTISGTLGVTANGPITQSGVLNVTGAATFAAGATNDITLGLANDFSSVGITTGRNVTLNDINALALNASTVSGTLGVTTNGAITQNGALAVTNAATFAAGAGNNITLTNAGNNFSSVAITNGNDVALTDTNSIILNASTISGTLAVNSAATTGTATITQAGALSVAGAASFQTNTTGTGTITLTNAGNSFANSVSLNTAATNSASVTNANGLTLGNSAVGGTLTAVATTGNITNAGTIAAGTVNESITTGGTGNIANNGNINATTLSENTNNGGAITETGGVLTISGASTFAAGTANNITLTNAGNDFNSIGITTGNNVLITDKNALVLNASTITGTLGVTTNGAITQAGALVVTGATTLNAGAANNITLGTATNNFSSIGITAANNVQITDTNAVALNASTVSGTLGVTAGGAITQNGALNVAGAATFAAGSGNNITLNNAGNDFSSVGITTGNNVLLTDANALILNASTVSGTLGVATGGAITQAGALAITGAATFAAGTANNITLNNAANNFSSVGITTGNNVALTDTNSIILNASTINGTLAVNSAATTGTATITQAGALNVSGAANFQTNTTANGAITLNTAGNNFGGVVAFTTKGTGAASITNTGGIVLDTSNLTAGLNVTAGGAITQAGALTVAGAATFAAGAANNITLTNAGNDFSSLGITTGNNVSITDANALILNASTVSGTLGVTTNGAITQAGALVVTGATTLNAGAANNITLGTATNNFSSIGITAANNVQITDTNAVALNASTVSGTLGVTAGGAITQNGALNVAGAATFAAGAANNITLNNVGNDFSSVGITTGNNVLLTDANALILNASTVSGTLGVTTGGAITQAGALAITGAATFAAGTGNNITLNNAANNFSSVGITTGNNVALTDTNSIILNASTISGTLAVNSAATTGIATITQAGALNVSGAANFQTNTTANGAITLNTAGNNFGGAVALTTKGTGAASITNTGGIVLGASNLTAGLNVTAGGAITQAGALTVAGAATFAAGAANNITLTNAGNDFASVGITNGNNVSLNDTNALILNASTVSGTLGITTNGAITQAGALAVAGAATFAAGSGNNITLNNAGNDFSNVNGIGITSGNNVVITDANTVALNASTISGTLNVNSTGAITQNGALNVAGAATFAAGSGNNITLNNAGNDFSSVGITTGNNVLLTDANALILNASTVSGTLGVTTGGAITQAGALAITGAATFAAGTGNNITLNNAANNFSSVGITTGNNVALTDTNSIVLNASTISGTLAVNSAATAGTATITQAGALNVSGAASFQTNTTANGAITLNTAGNNFGGAVAFTTKGTGAASITNTGGIVLGASNLTAGLNVTAGGAITQAGALTITGAATFAAGAANNITLTNAGNDFSSVGITSGNNVSITDANALVLNASTVSGALNVTTNGAITQAGALAVTGAATFAAGSGNDITLNNAGNDFSNVNGIGITSGNNVVITDANTVALNASTISGTLNVNSTGAITQNGALDVAGAATFAAGSGNNITLNNTGNDFSSVGITTGNNVLLTDANALILNASTVSGTLGVTTGGAITQAGALSVTGAATFAAGSGNDITLNNAGNDFSNVNGIGITSGNNVVITDANTVALNASTISGTLNVNSTGAITQNGALNVAGAATFAAGSGNNITLNNAGNDFSSVGITTGNNVLLTDANALVLNASTVSGTLGITTNGAITQNGALNVTGLATFAAGSGNDITLDNLANSFSSVAITSGNNTTIKDANALILNASTISGALNVTTNGAITQTGALSVTGAATFAAGSGNDITLNNAGNDFSNVNGIGITSGNNVVITDANTVALNASTISGTLNVNSTGAITQNGALDVAGAATFAAGAANNITLNNAGNDFSSIGITNGNNVSITNANALALNASTISGTLGVTTNGAITQMGALNVTGIATFAAGSSNDITLDNAANNFSDVNGIGITSGKNVVITDADAVALNASTISGTLNVNSNGAITQNGALAVTGAATFAAGAGNDITLGNAGNSFNTIAVASGDNVTLNNDQALNFAASTISGNLDVTTNGAITQTGAMTVNGATTLAAGAANDITLDNADNNFNNVTIISGNNITLNNNQALNLAAATVSGDLNVTTNGAITQSGALTVTGAATFAAGAGNDITLNNAANNFSNINGIGIISGKNVVITDANAVALNASTVSGTLAVNSNGAITQNGALAVTGAATFAAGTGSDINLGNAGNSFSSVGITTGNNVTIDNANALVLNASTVSGALDVTTNGAITQSGALQVTGAATFAAGSGNDITLDNAANDFSDTNGIGITSGKNVIITDANAVKLNASTINGTLNVNSTGAITQAGALNVAGTATFNAGAGNDITLTNTDNNFNSIAINSGDDVTLDNHQALNFAASTISGNLDVTTNGAITQNGALNVAGIATFAAGAANDITLDNAANNFNTVAINSAKNVTLNDANALTLNASTMSGNFDVTGATAMIVAGNITSGGNVSLHTNNAGIGTNDFSMDAGTKITATGNVDILANNSNGGDGNISFRNISAGDVITVRTDAGGNATGGNIDQDSGTLDGAGINLISPNAITLNGTTISSSGAININANTDGLGGEGFVAMNAGSSITGTDVTITVNAANGGNGGASLRNINTNGGTLTVITDTNGNLDGGSISQVTGSTIQTGSANFSTGDGVISLNDANDFTGPVTLTTHNGHAASIYDVTNLILGTSSVSGDLSVTANGISQTGAVTVGGTTTLNAGSNNINLDNANNNFNTVAITTANNATLRNNHALNFAASNVTGNLTASANGAITQTGALNIAGTLTTDSVGGTILNNDGNDINGFNATNVHGGNIDLNDNSNQLIISGIKQRCPADVIINNHGGITADGVITGEKNLTLVASGGALNIDATIDGTNNGTITLNDNSDIADAPGIINLNADVDSGSGDQIYNDAVVLGNNVSLTGKNITFNNTINGNYNLTLNSGVSGNILFNGNVHLNTLTVSDANNVTNNAVINVNQFQQLAGTGLTSLGSGGLNVTGSSLFVTNNVTGTINTGSLSLNTNEANLTGSVAGLTGQAAADKIVLLNQFASNTHFFDNIDLVAELSHSPIFDNESLVARNYILPYYLMSEWQDDYYYNLISHKPFCVSIKGTNQKLYPI